MLRLFKKSIPKEEQQEVTIAKSWTLEWESLVHDFGRYGKVIHNAMVFVNEEDLKEYKKQLLECAKFINSEIISIKIKENN